MVSFEKEYQRLNTRQKQAVDAIEGPVMVVAGPGTGKTQVVALRTANILRKTQARPGNILCLTFSTSGATAMRERLRYFIGADAYGVTVSTIHGFCNEVIAANPQVFEEWAALEQISDVERYRALNKIIDQLLPDLELVNRKQPYLQTRNILSRISQLKREGVADRETLRSVADEYQSQMEGKSKEGTKAHEKNVRAARKFHALLDVFFLYQEMLEKTQRYDYDDMILYVIKALEEEDWLLANLQERYQYILVDEFQDTNGAQYRLIELLTKPRTPEDRPNLFIVGDDDQAIYRFQGANLTNILSFHSRFPNAPTIALTTSYRCTQSILDAAGSLIENNTERLVGKVEGLEKNLTSPKVEPGAHPTLYLATSDMAEPWMVVDLIEERLKKDQSPETIAILTQTNAELQPLYDTLKARAIPVQMKGKVDLLNHRLVQQVIAILKAIEAPEDSGALAVALACATFTCHPADLGKLFALRREKEATLLHVLLNHLEEIDLYEREAVQNARDVILDLHHKRSSRTVIDTLEHLYKECGFLAKSDQLDPLDFAALQEFFGRIKYRAYEQPSFSFEVFLSDLEFYGKSEYSDLRLTYDLPHLNQSGVQLMTAHQSKGLEFETVFLVNFRDGHWDKRRNPSSISIPEDLLFGWEKDQKAYEKHQDERRVAFVAMTRAKTELIFTCAKELTSGDRSRSVSPSGFFAEAGELPEQELDLQKPEQASTLLFEPVRNMDEEFEAFLRSRLENFSLSVTALNHFLEDPKLFMELDLLQTPQSKQSGLVYGNAVHHALRKWGLRMQQGEEESSHQFIADFATYLEERELLTNAERARLKKVGEESLPRYFQQRLSALSPFVHKIEYPIKAHLFDIPIKGMIDRIDLLAPESAQARVIDYKTGRPKSENAIRDGDYFRQLVFYALLIENGYSILKPQEFVLDFIGESDEHPVERRFVITDEEKKDLQKVIRDVWAKVQALDFTPL